MTKFCGIALAIKVNVFNENARPHAGALFKAGGWLSCIDYCCYIFRLEGAELYQPIAEPIMRVKQRIETHLKTTFNVVLLRLYFGDDEIAWHTDAREFLGKSCSVASISLGATRRFDMKRVDGPLWPKIGGGGEESETKKTKSNNSSEVVSFNLGEGDLFVMQGETQQKFYHAVPKQRSVKRARFNLNFRRIILSNGQEAALRGHTTYYKYCVTGDDEKWEEKAKTFVEIEPHEPKDIASFFVKKPN